MKRECRAGFILSMDYYPPMKTFLNHVEIFITYFYEAFKSMTKRIKYKKEYCKQIIDFFNIPHTVDKYEVTTDKNGEKIKTIEKPNPLPTFEKFAVKIGVCTEVLDGWSKDYSEFALACAQCRALQKDMLNDLAMRGFYNPTYTIFVAKNITDMRDKQEVPLNTFEDVRKSYLKAMLDMGKQNI